MNINGNILIKKPSILSIGDIHGRSIWKIACFGTSEKYEAWRDNCDDPKYDLSELPLFMYDKIVFIGDYVDSWLFSNIEIKKNLEEIVHFKTCFPDKVVLILGNHDISYKDNVYCSGFKAEMLHDYKELFNTKINGDSIFQAAFQYKDWLWTHAGLTLGFYVTHIEKLLKEKDNRFYSFYKSCTNVAEILNFMYNSNNQDIFRVGYSRQGSSPNPGPFWADRNELHGKPAFGLNQIVGHTPCDKILGYKYIGGRYESHPISIYFIDNLEYGMNQVMSIDFNHEEPKIDFLFLNEEA